MGAFLLILIESATSERWHIRKVKFFGRQKTVYLNKYRNSEFLFVSAYKLDDFSTKRDGFILFN